MTAIWQKNIKNVNRLGATKLFGVNEAGQGAFKLASDFATAAQGVLATEALQPGQAATVDQGALADSAVQPNDPVSDLAETSDAKIMTSDERNKLQAIVPIFASRAVAIAEVIAASVTSIAVWSAPIPSTSLVRLEYYKDEAGTALTTAGGVKWSPVNDVYAEHFGSSGDGDDAKASTNTDAFDAAITFMSTRFASSGGTINFIGRHCTNRPIVIVPPRIFLKGQGPGVGVSRSEIRGIHPYGPVIRWKGDMPGGEDFIVSAANARRVATRITKSNYVGLGLTRDDMNFGIWLEPDDSPSNPAMDKLLFTRVSVHNQPSDGWVLVTRGYVGALNSCVSSTQNGHGIVISSGEYTARTNLYAVGVISLRDWSSHTCKGHGICVGTPDDTLGGGALRVLIHSCDNFNNASDASVRFAPYDTYMKADDSCIEYSALGGGSGVGAAIIGGKRVRLYNNRLLNLSGVTAPVKVMAETVPGRPSDGIRVERSYVNGGSFTDIVEVEVGSGRVEVIQPTLDGTFTGLSAGAAVAERYNVRRWDGSLQIPQMFLGKSTNDDTTAGARFVADSGGAVVSITRTSNVALILNRLTSNGVISTKRRDNVEISSDLVFGTTAVSTSATTIFTLNTRGGGLVIVTGTFNDGGTIRRFYDLVFFAHALVPVVLTTREENTPAARTYTVSASANLQLAMASGTYNVRAAATTATAHE